jgi:hypothetical protein
MYLQGLLKYKYYVKSLASIHNIEPEAFNDAPEVEVRDLLDGGKEHNSELQAEHKKEEIKLQAKLAPPAAAAAPKKKKSAGTKGKAAKR